MNIQLQEERENVLNDGWKEAKNRYIDFFESNKNKRILFLELGVGFNTPTIIKFHFIQMTYYFEDAFYVSINQKQTYLPDKIKDKSLII